MRTIARSLGFLIVGYSSYSYLTWRNRPIEQFVKSIPKIENQPPVNLKQDESSTNEKELKEEQIIFEKQEQKNKRISIQEKEEQKQVLSSSQESEIEKKKQEVNDKVNDEISIETSKSDKDVSQQVQPTLVKKLTSIKDLPQFPISSLSSDLRQGFVLIVADLPYHERFEHQFINKIIKISQKRESSSPLLVYRLNFQQPKTLQTLKSAGIHIQKQTMMVMKNPYEGGKFIPIDFDLMFQHPNIMPTYLSDVEYSNRAEFESKYRKNLENMRESETYILFAVDAKNEEQVKEYIKLTKYVQMQLTFHGHENIKVLAIDRAILQEQKLVTNPQPKSLHLLQPYKPTHLNPPNLYLSPHLPFHITPHINLSNRKGEPMLKRYLSRQQTFNTTGVDNRFICSVLIDRSKTDLIEERQIIDTIRRVKLSGKYPEIGFVLKYGIVEYTGQKQQLFSNRKWQIKVANLEQLDNELLAYEAKKVKQLEDLNIKPSNWQKYSHEYMYGEPELTQPLLQDFFSRAIQNKVPHYYRTEKKQKLQHVSKLTGQNFHEHILKNPRNSHLVFEYSDYCGSCMVLSPVIDYFDSICKMFPTMGIKVHALNCDRNRVKGQLFSPYTPNLYYYSKKWKNQLPIRYPVMQYFNDTGINGIYSFCDITDNLTKVDPIKFQKLIHNIQSFNIHDL